MDPKVNGQLQKDWTWLIAAYLFLGGVGSGAYVIGVGHGFGDAGRDSLATTVGLWLSWPTILIGTICLLKDLGSPGKAILAGLKVGSSWIARGSWIISIFMVLSFVHLILLKFTDTSGFALSALSVAGIIFALGTMAYTGILLSASKGVPFWRTGAVPAVFVVSALVTGHFSVVLGMVVFGGGGESVKATIESMTLESVALVVFEILVIFFFIQAAFRTPDSRESAMRILRQTTFVAGYIIGGLIAPLALMLVLRYAMGDSGVGSYLTISALGALLGLLGGMLLRHAVLVCGTMPTWNVAGFQFRRIAKPKDPKPGIGMMPPS
jgi:formate-dependent nitrite reductase membrane component NrfD